MSREDVPVLRLAGLRAPGGAPVSLEVMAGEAVSLIGPEAGAVVAMVAGLRRPQSGSVTLGGARPRPGRGVGALIGAPGLLPRRDLAGNAALGGAQGAELLAELGLGPVARFYPGSVSAAQALGAALARGLGGALAGRPGVLLLDPDLAGLDAAARRDFFARLGALRASRGFAVLHAAAEAEDAWALADRVAVLGPMGIRAVGSPRELYARPADAVVARALGPANLLAGTVRESDGEEADVALAAGMAGAMAHAGVGVGQACLVLVRPEDVAVLPGVAGAGMAPDGIGALPARVAGVRFQAGWNEVTLVLGAGALGAGVRGAGVLGTGVRVGGNGDGLTVRALRPAAAPLPAVGEACAIAWPAARAQVLPAE
jgi:ABC-type sulfate/molybdate transport systems ATPase subunit